MFGKPIRRDVLGNPCLFVNIVKTWYEIHSLKIVRMQTFANQSKSTSIYAYYISTSKDSHYALGILNSCKGHFISCNQCLSGGNNTKMVMIYQHYRLILMSDFHQWWFWQTHKFLHCFMFSRSVITTNLQKTDVMPFLTFLQSAC